MKLSRQVRSLWAKTGSGEQRGLWIPLYIHMVDSAEVALRLWQEWLPTAEKRLISSAAGNNEEAAMALVAWLAGIHDIGKATPNFQCKVPERAELVNECGLSIPPCHMVKGHSLPHAFMGEAIIEHWLEGRGWPVPSAVGCVVGGHHGAPPSRRQQYQDMWGASAPAEVLGESDWRQVQDELLEWMFSISGAEQHEEALSGTTLTQPVEVLLTGLVIMADWIASNADLFPMLDGAASLQELRQRADYGWARLALPPAWHLSETDGKRLDALGGSSSADDWPNRLFHARFPKLPDSALLRPAQLEAINAAIKMKEPGLIIIEAPMGNGKTEASLLCAEILGHKFGADGLAYLLPTMATSNAMFSRVDEWLNHLVQGSHSPQQSIQLMHSKAALNREFSGMCRWGSSWMGDSKTEGEDERVIAHQWFGGRKRGLLASYVVGTIDQLLMAALKTRHVQLRHLGLAGKVVVIDEVHAYDAYMSTYLGRVLAWLGAYGAPTIMLSATLPPQRRKELIRAYRGNDKTSRSRTSHRKDIPDAPRLESGAPAYPLVISASRDKDEAPLYAACAQGGDGTDVRVSFVTDDDEALLKLLSDLLEGGGCACVLRDTVRRAQETYELIKEHLDSELAGAQVKLVHSRFIAADRMGNDAELLELLGHDSDGRPEKLVVVGTQVIEQSLDIDFDVMVTDIAPVDLLLQRMGRLHRHARGYGQSNRPEKLRVARCFIAGMEDLEAMPPIISKGIDKVYPKALLYKTLLALFEMRDSHGTLTVNLPHDIARLVECVYREPKKCGDSEPDAQVLRAPDDWQPALNAAVDELLQKQEKAMKDASTWLLGKPIMKEGKNLIGWLRDSVRTTDEAVGRAAVRDSQESIEVIAVQRHGDELCVFPWLRNSGQSGSLGTGLEVPDDDAARIAATCTLSLPPRLAMPENSRQVVNALESTWPITGWQESRWLKGELPLVFDEKGKAVIDIGSTVYHLAYTREEGLVLEDAEKKERG